MLIGLEAHSDIRDILAQPWSYFNESNSVQSCGLKGTGRGLDIVATM